MLKYFSNAVSIAELQSDYKRLLQKHNIAEHYAITEEYSKLYECLIKGISMFDLEHESDIIKHIKDDISHQPTDRTVLFMHKENVYHAPYISTLMDYSRQYHRSYVKVRYFALANKNAQKIKRKCGFMDCTIISKEHDSYASWRDSVYYDVDIMSDQVQTCTLKYFFYIIAATIPSKKLPDYDVYTIKVNDQTVYALFDRMQCDTKYLSAYFYINDKLVISRFDLADIEQQLRWHNREHNTLLNFATEHYIGALYGDIITQLDLQFNDVAKDIGFRKTDQLHTTTNIPVLDRYIHTGVITVYKHSGCYTGKFNRDALNQTIIENNITLDDIESIIDIFNKWYNDGIIFLGNK